MSSRTRVEQLQAVASISDPLRRSLYTVVARSPSPIGRDEAAAALGIPRQTAAFHLERLVESGVLETEFQRRTGRTGPGAGRPAKLYRPATAEVSASVPERHYDLAAELLSSAVEESDRTGAPIGETLRRVSTEFGHALGTAEGNLNAVLESTGYEPVDDDAGGLLLSNCPFHQLAQSHTQTICGANVAMLRGAVDGAGECDRRVDFEPRTDGYCCVHVVPVAPGSSEPDDFADGTPFIH
ncbi:MAG: helix-turn-helix domain-containing protein [Mycetocola sp.]